MKDEALKLALEALELHGKQYPHMVKGYCLDAITAIRESLAQPEQERKMKSATTAQEAIELFPEVAYWHEEFLKHNTVSEKPKEPEQEPVALPEKIYEFVPTPEPVKWHHPECEGQCIACLIEQVVQEAYGSQGLGYLQRHLTSPPQRKKD